MQPRPDPIFGATTPVPDDEIKAINPQQATPASPLFWGRKYVPPSPQERAAAMGPQPYPKMMYHPDGRMQAADNEEQCKLAIENGWQEQPDVIHRELLQFGDGGKSGKRLPTAGSDEVTHEEHELKPKVWQKEKAKA